MIAANDALPPSAVITSRRASTETSAASASPVAGAGSAPRAADSGPMTISTSTGSATTRSRATGAATSPPHPTAATLTIATVTPQNQPLNPASHLLRHPRSPGS